MKLKEIIADVPVSLTVVGDDNIDVTSLCNDSRRASEGAMFFCTPGYQRDGHDYAPQAVENGAAVLVVERILPLNCVQVVVDSVRRVTAYMSAAFYGYPAKELKLVALTGTKGKTTASYLVKSIVESAGKKVGIIGTVGALIGDERIPEQLTTPDPIEIQSLLRRMADAGTEYVIMEASAHALAMDRLSGLKFEVAAFSNLSQDHLDFFGTLDNYYRSKRRILMEDMSKSIVYNVDDEHVTEAIAAIGRPALRTGIRESSDIYANDIEVCENGCTFLLTYHKRFRISVRLHLSGLFNVYNALLAAGIAISLGIGPDAIRRGIEAVRAVPGRVELLETNTPYRVILDYAHSPDSLENILIAVRESCRGKLYLLFGCGGDRDQLKRPIMGEIAGKLADYCIITSDNPRSEDPMEILKAIEAGIKPTGCEYIIIEDRRKAIKYALELANSGDVVLLAGKGHETYQEIKDVRHPFDEKKIVAELLAKKAPKMH